MACGNKPIQGTGSVDRNRSGAASGLRVLCYNIHHANPPSKPGIIDLEAIAKVIRDNSPDLVALQEVDVNTIRSGKTSNQAADIAKLSGMPHYYFAKAIDHEGGEYGVAILSRFPMEDMKNTQLPTEAETKGERRTLATAVIRLPDGKRIVFASTHLDAQKSDTNRFLQINKITEILQHEKLPVVIAGDFNAYPSTRIINRLDHFFKRSCIVDCGHTIPVVNPRNTIDYVAFSPDDKFTVTEHKVIDEKYASDHLPVSAVLKMK
ncbi:MAG: endonuclease/exonuclease/phosphatase [Flavisolibacter sp.]|jgi:endonuclease/exonuclease/phosphatase family metal-dependent hydrolase|nr:endonuclease/exonuclease/phosphatase [Flavisolibacter sp.]